jgi:hypothetical protein
MLFKKKTAIEPLVEGFKKHIVGKSHGTPKAAKTDCNRLQAAPSSWRCAGDLSRLGPCNPLRGKGLQQAIRWRYRAWACFGPSQTWRP